MPKVVKSPTVDQYIKPFPAKTQTILKKIRQLVHKLAPQAVEGLNYGLIGYKLNGKPLVYFGGWKNHIGFYATPAGHAAFKKELAGYVGAKGSVKFPLSEPMPYALLTRMIRYRVREESRKASKMTKAKAKSATKRRAQ